MSSIHRTIARRSALCIMAATFSVMLSASVSAKTARGAVTVRISGKETSILPSLTEALGNFEREGIDAKLVANTDYAQPDYRVQRALNTKQIDMAVHWFQHVIYGDAHGEPTRALMLFNDAPGITIMVADKDRSRVKSAKDFAGLKVAEGGGYATKSMVVNYLTARAGLPKGSYTPVFTAVEGREEATIKALEDGAVDVIAFREPMASAIANTGKTWPLYQLTTGTGTAKVLGAPLAAQSLFATPDYIAKNPQTVQRVVNAFTRTMRFINTHSADEIYQRLPDSYFVGKNREEELRLLRANLGTYTKGNYAITPAMAKLQLAVIDNAPFDDGEEGQFRRRARNTGLKPGALFTNVFVDKAAANIR